MGSGLMVSPSPSFHRDFLNSKLKYWNLFLIRVHGSCLKEIICLLQFTHQPQDEVTVKVSPEIKRVAFGQ